MNFLALIASFAALMWTVAFALRAPLVVGCLVFVTLTVCFGYDFVHFDVGSLPLTFDRLWMGVLLAMFFVQRKLGRTDRKPLAWVDVVLMTFLGLLTISTFAAAPTTGSKMAGSPLWHLVVAYLFPAALYFVARQSSLTETRVSIVHGFLACFGIYLGVTGIAEMTGQWWLVFPHYIADPKVGLHFGRARGPMIQSVSYGLYLGICAIAMILWMQRFSRPGKLVLLALVPIPLVAAALTLTRSVWMGTGLALIVLAAVALRDTWRKLVLFSAIGLAAVMLLTKMDTIAGFEREGSVETTRTSAASRASFAYVSWKMFQDRPLLGFGFGQFPEAKLPYLADRTTPLNLEIIRPLAHHNTYLSLLVELGLVGLLLYVALLGMWLRYAWRLARGGRRPAWVQAHGTLVMCAIATYCVQMLFHDVSFTSIDNAIIFLLAGMAVGLSYGGMESRRMDFGRREDRRWFRGEEGEPVTVMEADVALSPAH